MEPSNSLDEVDQAEHQSSDSDADCDVYDEDPIRKVLRGITNIPEDVINKIRCVYSLDANPLSDGVNSLLLSV